MGGRAIATIRALGMNSDLEQTFMEACIGEGAAQEWCAWAVKADLPNPRDVLLKGWEIDKNRLDRTMAVFSSITALVLSVQDKKEQYELATKAWERLGELLKKGLPDICMRTCAALVENGLCATASNVPDALKKAAEPVVYELGKSGLVKYL